ncbi:MAG: hypothetical protein J7L32_03340 [Thermoplasmata archaeon]|nr:hypothetical protein [Thermoplasmata archaeon]
MRRILTSIMTIGVVAAMMGVGTFAYFNDVESAGFTISAGAIDLEVDGENPWCESFDFELKPSWDWEKNFTLHMTADSNPAKAWFRLKGIVDGNGFETEPELWAEGAVYNCTTHEWDRTNWQPIHNLSDHIKVDIAIQSDTQGMWMWYIDEDGDGSYEWVAKSEDWDWSSNLDMLPTLGGLNNTWIQLTQDCHNPPYFEPCHNYTFHLSLHNTLNGNDNEYQGDTTSFTIEFYATQLDYQGTTPPQ